MIPVSLSRGGGMPRRKVISGTSLLARDDGTALRGS